MQPNCMFWKWHKHKTPVWRSAIEKYKRAGPLPRKMTCS